MDRLLQSSSPVHLKVCDLKCGPFLSRLPTRFNSSRFLLSGPKLRQLYSVSANKQKSLPIPADKVPSPFPLQDYHLSGSVPQFSLSKTSTSPKWKVPSASKSILLSAAILFLLSPLSPSPAFATFSATASAGSHAATAGSKLISFEFISSAFAGFFAGCLHTLSGPDHLAALAPLSIGRTPAESAFVGALWGCGHDAGQVIFGLLFLLLKDRLHIEIIRTWSTRVVGCTLLIIGAIGIREATEVPTPCVALENGECEVSYYDSLGSTAVGKKNFGFATFATGIIHGLQPDALMIILPALAMPSRLAGVAYLVMFLVGTVAAMSSYTVFLCTCSQALKERVPRITEKLTWASSLIAIGLGLAILVSQLFGFGLY